MADGPSSTSISTDIAAWRGRVRRLFPRSAIDTIVDVALDEQYDIESNPIQYRRDRACLHQRCQADSAEQSSYQMLSGDRAAKTQTIYQWVVNRSAAQ